MLRMPERDLDVVGHFARLVLCDQALHDLTRVIKLVLEVLIAPVRHTPGQLERNGPALCVPMALA